MFLILFNWLIIVFICLSIGDLVKQVLKAKSDIRKSDTFLIFLVGFVLVSADANILSLCFPIKQWYFIIIFCVALTWVLCNFNRIKESIKQFTNHYTRSYPLMIPIWILISFLAASLSSSQTLNVDEGGYYLPLVRWIESYPVVAGSGLFNARIAQNSIYHMSQAVFGHQTWFNGGMYDLNGLLFVFFNLTAFHSLFRLYERKYNSLYKDILLAAALLFPFSFVIDSMDTDYPSIFISIYFIALTIARYNQKRFWQIDFEYYTLWMIGFFLLMTKLFSGAVLIFPLLILCKNTQLKNYGTTIFTTLLGVFLLAPWIIRNYYLSGYLIYPLHFIDVFEADWKIPLELAKQHYLVIQDFAKTEIIRSTYFYDGVQDLSISDWIVVWLHRTWDMAIGKALIIFLPLSLLATVYSIINRQFNLIWVQLYLLIVILFWFFKFPSIRFCWHFILAFMVISAVRILKSFEPKLIRMFCIVLGSLCFFSFSRTLVNTVRQVNLEYIFTPEKTQTLNDFEVFYLDSIPIIKSKDEYCNGAKVPCIPYHNNLTIKNKGSDVKSGFFIEK